MMEINNDGWIEWHGGECPIKSDKTVGVVKFRGGSNDGSAASSNLRGLNWFHFQKNPSDIIAYRITENHEPAETAPIDMSQNRVPWGLLTDAERGALDAWVMSDKPVEIFVASEWRRMQLPRILTPGNVAIYRTVAPPVITETVHGVEIDGHTVTITLTRHDGKPISGTVVV